MDKYIGRTLAEGHASSVALRVIDGGLSTAAETSEIVSADLQVIPRTGGCSEISRAIDRINALVSAVTALHRTVREGRVPTLRHCRRAIAALIDDFSADPHALYWALSANRRMYHLCRRSVGCAVWALAMGRQLDFSRDDLSDLMLGALLLDIGKLRIPVVILAKMQRLNDAEHKFARRHVSEGLRILEAIHAQPGEALTADVVEMVRSHHERADGSGYPCRLRGDELSLFARIAGIVDSYDALTVHRYYAEGASGSAALAQLRKQAEQFDSQLLQQFCCAIGEFPVGSWVEFADGSTGVVCSRNPDGSARAALIADEKQQPFLEVRWISLHRHGDARILPPAERPEHAGAMERSLQSAIYAFRPRRF